MRRCVLVAVVLAVASGAPDAWAGNAEVRRDGNEILFTGLAADSNAPSVTLRGTEIAFSDDSQVPRAGPGCREAPDPNRPGVGETICDAAGLTTLRLVLGAGPDHLEASGIASDMPEIGLIVNAGPGRDEVFVERTVRGLSVTGGDDGDHILAPDTMPVEVDGGAGDDRVTIRRVAARGAAGGQRITGGDGNDLLFAEGFGAAAIEGGPGRDVIGVQDDSEFDGNGNVIRRGTPGPADHVSCGPDGDRVHADGNDRVRGDCEPPRGTLFARPESGTVRIRAPGARTFTTLTGLVPVRRGTLIDARRGHVVLVGRSGTQSGAQGEFWAGRFEISTVGSANAPPRLRLFGNPCRGTTGRLWSDLEGPFRVLGRYGQGTGVDARWLTENGCRGTRFRVARGTVTVRRSRGGSVQVRAGTTYLATAP